MKRFRIGIQIENDGENLNWGNPNEEEDKIK